MKVSRPYFGLVSKLFRLRGATVAVRSRALLPILLLLSGFCGISYEVLYAKLLGNLLGDQFTISAAVLLTFMAGIAEGETNLGQFARFYARDLPYSSAGGYQVVRFGERFIDPDSGEYLGRAVIRIGTANLISGDELSILELVYSHEEVVAGDRLVPVKEDAALPDFFPRIPEVDLQGHIVGIATGVREAGLFSVVTVSVGTEDGVQPGDMLQVSRPATANDSVASRPVELTRHSSADVMIFKVFHKASFALIIKARRPVNLHDHISIPEQSSDI